MNHKKKALVIVVVIKRFDAFCWKPPNGLRWEIKTHCVLQPTLQQIIIRMLPEASQHAGRPVQLMSVKQRHIRNILQWDEATWDDITTLEHCPLHWRVTLLLGVLGQGRWERFSDATLVKWDRCGCWSVTNWGRIWQYSNKTLSAFKASKANQKRECRWNF